MSKTLFLVFDQSVVDRYNEHYFKLHTRARKLPIERPIHPSINQWMILPRMQMNQLKQKWKAFIVWWVKDLGYQDLKLDKFEIEVKTYMPTKRRSDPDNFSPKFINDGFTEAGLIIDDDGNHLKKLSLITDYDKDHPRTEVTIKILD